VGTLLVPTLILYGLAEGEADVVEETVGSTERVLCVLSSVVTGLVLSIPPEVSVGFVRSVGAEAGIGGATVGALSA
jgi:hypothetical protein